MKPKYINMLAFAVVISIISPAFASMCTPGPVSPAHHNCINGVPYQKYQNENCAVSWVKDDNPLFAYLCRPPQTLESTAIKGIIKTKTPVTACIPGPVSPAHHNCINGVPYQKYQNEYCATGWVRDYNPLLQDICGPRIFTYDDGTIHTNQYLGQRTPDPLTYGLYLKRVLANMSKSVLSTGLSPKAKTTGYPCEPGPVTPAVRKCYYPGGWESGILVEIQQKSDCTKEWARSNNTLLENHLCRILHIGYKRES